MRGICGTIWTGYLNILRYGGKIIAKPEEYVKYAIGREHKMSTILADDLRVQYDKAFETVGGIIEAFPEDKWLVPHGDEYYIPCRIAYHIAVFIDGMVADGFKDPDFRAKVPFGDWKIGTAETLPDKSALAAYYKEVIGRAKNVLAALDDDAVTAMQAPEMSRFGTTKIGAHMMTMRELSAHTGELNKMLIENGQDDIWR